MKNLFTTLFSLFIFSASFSQVSVTLGPKIGYSAFAIESDEITNEDPRTGVAPGAFLNVAFADFLSVQTEANYYQKGGQFETIEVTQNTKDIEANYLNFPLLAKLRIPLFNASVLPNIYAGQSFGIKVSENQLEGTEEGVIADPDDYFEPLDYSTVLGGGVDLEDDKVMLSLDARYIIGNYDVGKAGFLGNAKHNGFVISAAFGIQLTREDEED